MTGQKWATNLPRMASTNRVRELREAKGWSQETLAYIAGVSVKTVARAENGKDPSVETALKLSRALRVKLDKLFVVEVSA